MGRNFRRALQSFAWVGLLLPLAASAQSGAWRERLLQRHGATAQQASRGLLNLPPGARLVRDVAYGSDPQQRFDVYLPAQASAAPVIFMVHGGGWRRGDKAARGVVQNKIDRWLPRGFVVISTNYRLLPEASPLQQAQDVARALALAQREAPSWGADPRAFILMGHSAGAHLVALLSAEPSLAREQGAQPWLGTVSLDSAALDVVQIMQGRHLHLYDAAFGAQPADWLAASPYQQMHGRMAPFLAVCSGQRRESCLRAHDFARKARSFGGEARVLEEGLTHGQINAELGLPSEYTAAVEHFMRGLGTAVAQRLGSTPPATSSR